MNDDKVNKNTPDGRWKDKKPLHPGDFIGAKFATPGTGAKSREVLLDGDWAGKAFLVPESSLTDATDEYRRYFTSSSRKFVSSALGGHTVINPIPQMTANCDVPHDAFFSGGLDTPSRWWSEVLDDNMQTVHFRPGVPKFNSLTTFFGNFYNVEMGSIARTGRGKGIAYTIGRAIGTVGTLPLQPFILGSAMVKFFLHMPRSKYYYLSPTSFPYRYAVQTMLNAIMSNEGMLSGSMSKNESQFIDDSLVPNEIDDTTNARAYGSVLSRYGFMTPTGGIDIFAVSTSTQRLAQRFKKGMEDKIETLTARTVGQAIGSDEEATILRADIINTIIGAGMEEQLQKLSFKHMSLDEFGEIYQHGIGRVSEDPKWMESSLMLEDPPADTSDMGLIDKAKAYLQQSWDHFKAEIDYGADYVSFRCNWTGTQSESFSNQSGESSIASSINGMSSRAREIRFNTMDGNAVGGALGAALNVVTDTAMDMVTGLLDSVNLSGAIALAGNAFADIQKMYQSSSADLNRTTFTIHLRSWSADPFVRMQNVWMPLVHLMCLGLPRATGPGSYDGPFLVECVNRGKTLIREGYVENISIERGVGDIGFGRGMEALGIDVTVTVADMSSILSIPISSGVGLIATMVGGVAGTGINAGAGLVNALGGNVQVNGVDVADTAIAAMNKNLYSEDNKYTDYLTTLTSLPLDAVINPKRKWKMNMARMKSDLASNRTAGNLAATAWSVMPGDLLKAVFSSTANRY